MKHGLQVRVASGAWRGRRLRYPRGRDVRPTMQRTREAVFDSLGDVVAGAGFADLYAAAGGVGIEALSRGASFVHFVETDARALECLRENIETLGVEPERYAVHPAGVEAFVAGGGLDDPRLRVVFADPPYDDDIESLLALLDGRSYPQVRFLVVEHRGALAPAARRWWRPARERSYGSTTVSYFEPYDGENT